MRRSGRGSWILAVVCAWALFSPSLPAANAADSKSLVFAYQTATVYQEVNVNTSNKSSLTLTVSAAETQDWKASSDLLNIGIALYGSGGGLIYQHSTGNIAIDSAQFSDYSISVSESGVGSGGWSSVATARAFIIGQDGEFWAGNYGTRIESASLKFDDNVELLSNTEFTSTSSWTSDIGWQSCSGGSGALPCVSVAVPATSIEVTSLADTSDSGTLRWAIAQANATSGGIYDSITFTSGLSGTITLGSALPALSQNLTITGPGQNVITIDGIGAYRPFMVNVGISLTLSNLTLKRGQNTNGGLIYNNRGTVSASNVRFTSMTGGSAVFNNNGGAVATYTNCTFDNLSIGIAGDYGSTPSLPAGTTSWSGYADSGFQNRTYVNSGTFSNNWAGIYNYRFTKIENSTFTSNSYGANVTGLNRTQIYNSTFDTNTVAVYHSAWIPTSFNMGTDNRLITGNTFTNNGTSIYLDDGYNNGQRYQGWSTVSNNTWDENGTWIQYSYWNSSSNVTATATPYTTDTQFIQNSNTVPTTTTTTTTVPETTTTTEPEPTTTEQETTTTTEVEPETTVPETTTTIDSPSTGTTIEETTTTTEPEQEPEATTTTIAIPDEPVEDNIEETTTQPEEPDGAESIQDTETTVPEPAPDTEDEAPQDANNEVVEVTAENLEEVLSGEITSEVLDSVVEALESGDIELTPEVAEAVVSAITSEDATEEQIVAAVELLIESGQLSSGIAEELATSPQVLESITSDEASEIFDAVSVSDLTEDAAEEIINAVQEAPTEVREAFETEINVFGGKFDTYIPVGSAISVAERRTVVAVTVVSSVMVVTSAAAAPPAPSQPTGGGGGSSGGGPASTEPSDSGKPRRRRGGE